MKSGLIYLVFFAFFMMILQNFLSYLQYKSYQKAVKALQGKGWILGIGMRKGGFHLKGGGIVVIAWDRNANRVMACKKLSGIAMWKRFEDVDAYNGMTLNAVRAAAIAEDLSVNKRLREKEPYSPLLADKRRKKGALIQAVEAIDRRLAKELQNEEQTQTVKEDGLGRQEIQERLRARQREIRKNQSGESKETTD